MTTALPRLAHGPLEMPRSGIREVINEALTIPGCIRLEVGEPNFPTPQHIVEAAFAFARSGGVRYTATAGMPSLREKIAAKLAAVNGISASPDRIHLGIGGVGAIAAAIHAIVEPGDEVLLPDPAWPCYELMLGIIGGRAVPYRCAPQNGFLPDPSEIESLIGPRTKVLVVNSPGNPTGAVFPRELIEALVDLAARRNVYLLSDECYDEVVYEGEHVSPLSIGDGERIVSAFSFSKTYAMTGWRIGYVVTSDAIAASVNKVHEGVISCVSAVSQAAAEAALDGPKEPVRAMVDAYRSRRDLAFELLDAAGLAIIRPGGAFYVMADITSSRLGARDFAFDLLREKHVAVAPGTAFGTVADGAVRISLASSEDDLREGIDRLIDRIQERA